MIQQTNRKKERLIRSIDQQYINKNLRPFDGTRSRIATQIPRCWCHFHGDRVISLTSKVQNRSQKVQQQNSHVEVDEMLDSYFENSSSNLGPHNFFVLKTGTTLGKLLLVSLYGQPEPEVLVLMKGSNTLEKSP